MPCQWIELVDGQPVGHPQGDGVALAPAQRRRRHRAVDGGGRPRAAGEVDRRLADGQVELAAGKHRRAGGGGGEAGRGAQAEAGEGAAGGDALHETAAGQGAGRRSGGAGTRVVEGHGVDLLGNVGARARVGKRRAVRRLLYSACHAGRTRQGGHDDGGDVQEIGGRSRGAGGGARRAVRSRATGGSRGASHAPVGAVAGSAGRPWAQEPAQVPAAGLQQSSEWVGLSCVASQPGSPGRVAASAALATAPWAGDVACTSSTGASGWCAAGACAA